MNTMFDNTMYDYICVWADGSWCYPDEVTSYSHMSDDYAYIKQQDFMTNEELADAHTRNALHADWYIR